jgi:hypothetical protein
MLRKSDNIFRAIIAEGTTAAITAGVIASPATIPNGAVAITDLAGKVLDNAATTALSATDRFIIVQGKGATEKLMKTCPLTKGELTITPGKYAAAVQQVTAVGFNGTTGSLSAANSTDYWITVQKNDNNGRDNSQGTRQFAGPIKSDATATQEEVAFALVKQGIKNFSSDTNSANQYLKFEALCDEAGAAITSGGAQAVTHFTFTKGSKEVLASNGSGVTAKGTATLTNMVATARIKIAAATTSPIYIVDTIVLGTGNASTGTTTTLTLNIAYQGETVSVAIGDAHRIVAADAILAEAGVRMTGVESEFNVNTFRNYYTNRFTATFSDTAVPITSLAGAKNGTGVWQQAAMDEYMTYGFEGQGALGTPPTTRDAAVIKNAKYGVVQVSWKSSMNYLVSNGNAEGTVLLYAGLNGTPALPTSTAAGYVADQLGDIAVPSFVAASVLV